MKNHLTFEESRQLYELNFLPVRWRAVWRRPIFGNGEWVFCKAGSLMSEISDTIPVFYESDVLQLLARFVLDLRAKDSGTKGNYVHIEERGDRQWEVTFMNCTSCGVNLIDAAFSVLKQIHILYA